MWLVGINLSLMQHCFLKGLSHDECIFMRKTGYEVLSEFLMIVNASFFDGDTRAVPRRPEVPGDITQKMLADWLILGYH